MIDLSIYNGQHSRDAYLLYKILKENNLTVFDVFFDDVYPESYESNSKTNSKIKKEWSNDYYKCSYYSEDLNWYFYNIEIVDGVLLVDGRHLLMYKR